MSGCRYSTVPHMRFDLDSYPSRCMSPSCSAKQQGVAVQVLRTLPPDTIDMVLKEQSTLWKYLKPHEVAGQVLRLPAVFVEEWLSSKTTLDLRDSTLPLSQTLGLIRFLPTQQNLRVLHLSCGSSSGRPDDTLCVLEALNRALEAIPRCQLWVLGLMACRFARVT